MQKIGYYPLKKMEKEGLVEKREVGDSHIKKYIYSITPKGEKEFLLLCTKALISQRRPFMEFDLPIYFLPFLERKKILPLFRLRFRFLNRARDWLRRKKVELRSAPKNQRLLISHHLKLITAEISFLKEMARDR